jgi:Ankyrin repeats (3 copies)/Ankyrin repeats (many copies)
MVSIITTGINNVAIGYSYDQPQSGLSQACADNDLNYLKKEIERGIDPSIFNNEAIQIACQRGHLEIVKYLLTDSRVDPSSRLNWSIYIASDYGHDEIVSILLKDNRVNPADHNNFAIRAASENGHLKVVQLLMNDNRVNPADHNNSAINHASKNGHLKVVELLLTDPRVDPSTYNNWAIEHASQNAHYEVVKLLFNHPKVNPQGQDCVKHKNGQIVKLVNVIGDVFCYIENGKILKILSNLENIVKEDYIRWQYRIGGEKYTLARNSLELPP